MALDSPHKAAPEEWRERHMFLKAVTNKKGVSQQKQYGFVFYFCLSRACGRGRKRRRNLLKS
jgi:hypothetical protein